ncbi:MAG TPA: ATP-binding protein [Candidatus Agrococcus pullicola]|uniref:ATP-binding protein n=1 Tax=Candidatus Agrococcus pullicola TaxID=2838429 RepID=A0A9D2C9A2_9MICO|nr:ATP-binding protein [Candidatus Agrococcus pullicola]
MSTSAHAIFVVGVSASGKSTLGRSLARELGWTMLDLDTMTNPLFEAVGGEAKMLSSDAQARRTTINSVRYECLFATAAENLGVGNSVVLVAPFTSERLDETVWRQRLSQLGLAGDSATLVWVDTPRNIVLQRIRARRASRDLAWLDSGVGLAPVDAFGPPVVDHMRIDGTITGREQLEAFRESFAITG